MWTPTHLEGSLLYSDLTVDSSSIIRTYGLQLVFAEGEELSSSQHTQTVHSPVQTEHTGPHQSPVPGLLNRLESKLTAWWVLVQCMFRGGQGDIGIVGQKCFQKLLHIFKNTVIKYSDLLKTPSFRPTTAFRQYLRVLRGEWLCTGCMTEANIQILDKYFYLKGILNISWYLL